MDTKIKPSSVSVTLTTDYRVVHLHVWHNIAIYQHKCWQCVHTSRRSSNVRLRDGHRQMDKIKQFGFF